jgi:hypothetical protein
MQAVEKVEINNPSGVDNWFEWFILQPTINKDMSANQTPYLLTMMGRDAYDLVKKLVFL